MGKKEKRQCLLQKRHNKRQKSAKKAKKRKSINKKRQIQKNDIFEVQITFWGLK